MKPHGWQMQRGTMVSVTFATIVVGILQLSGCSGRETPVHPDPTGNPAATGHDGMTPEEMAAMSMPADPPAGSAAGMADMPGMVAAPDPPEPGRGDIDIPAERLQAIGVRFETVRRRELNREIRAVGRVAIDERRLARVNVKTEGWIERLLVNTTGERVAAGQPLFTLYSPELVATQEEYLLALRGVRALGETGIGDVAAGSRSVLGAARRRLALWDVADADVRRLEASGRVLKSLPIHAPLGGTVIEKMAVSGMRVMPGDDLYVIADLDRVWVLADIYEYELPFVAAGQEAVISLSYDPSVRIAGRLAFVYPTLERETRTARVRFEVDNSEGKLKPDMYANVALDVSLGTRLVVPKDAVLESGRRSVSFVRRGPGKLAWREVRTGARAGSWVEVAEGLAEGEEIVTSANFLIDSESQVKGAMAGMPGMEMPAVEPQAKPGGDRPPGTQ